jgi:flagellar biosynthesis protein FlhG
MRDQADRLRELISQQLATQASVQTPEVSDGETPTAPSTLPTSSARVIVVTSGKGGVGKTNITVNLAMALAKRGKRTILFDADLGMANVDVIMGVSPKANLAEVISGRKTMEEILLPYNEFLEIVPGGSGISELADLDQAALDRFVSKLKELEHRADFILVDTGAGISRTVLNFVLAANEVLLVTTPEPTAITDAYGLIKALDQHNPLARVQLLINMVESDIEARAVAQKLIMIVNRFLDIEVNYLTCLERDPNISRSVLQQQPFYLAFPYGPSTRRINMLASLITEPDEDEPAPPSSHGFFSRVAKLFR